MKLKRELAKLKKRKVSLKWRRLKRATIALGKAILECEKKQRRKEK